MMDTAQSTVVVGVPVADLSMLDVVDVILSWTESPGVKVAVGVNAAVCNLAATDPSFRQQLLSATLTYADGQSVVWAAKALGSRIAERVATTDLIYPLASECARRSKRVYLYGGAPDVAERAGARLAERFPGLLYKASHGYIPPEDMLGLLADITAYKPDLLLIGLGDPLQQKWVADHRHLLSVPAVLTCGGLFDWVSGVNRRAPQWMISGGLEWCWRLILEPRRLARRYLLGNPAFLARFGAQLLQAKLRPARGTAQP